MKTKGFNFMSIQMGLKVRIDRLISAQFFAKIQSNNLKTNLKKNEQPFQNCPD